MRITVHTEVDPDGTKVTVLKPDSEGLNILYGIPDLRKRGDDYISTDCMGDCLVEILYEKTIQEKCSGFQYSGTITAIRPEKRMNFGIYSPSVLLKLLMEQKNGTKTPCYIQMKEQNMMEDYEYHVTCPSFDEVDMDYRGGRGSLKGYAHPIDEKIIKVLDNPAINAVFRTVSDFGADNFYGTMLATGIPLNHENHPEEDAIIRHCSERLGIKRPYAIISNQLPGINAMTVGSDDAPYLVLSSLLVKVMSKEQLTFVIGHECGHIAMGHVVYHSAVATAGSLAQLIPVIGEGVYNLVAFPLNAWERRSEITADRAGLLCCEDLELAQRTLLQLETAFQNADDIDITTYVENSKRFLKKGTIRKFGEVNANHPLISKRIEALEKFAKSRCYLELTKQPVTSEALTDRALEKAIEEIIKVF